LLYRAGYGEKLGSGLLRIKQSLKENGNPNYQISNTNFFNLRLLPRVRLLKSGHDLSSRQLEIIAVLSNHGKEFSSSELAGIIGVSATTISRDMKLLIEKKLVNVKGTGRAIKYSK